MPRPDIIPQRGAAPRPLELSVVRELTPEDLLRASDAPKTAPPPLQRLRAIHHRQAQLLASGRTISEVAAIVGSTPQRITQLQHDPTFTDLVAYYQDQIMSAMIEDTARLKDKLVDLGEMAVDELRDRMEDDGRRKGIGTGDVRKIAEMALDRTVAPPKIAAQGTSAPAAITINFGTSLSPTGKAAPEAIDVTPSSGPAMSPPAMSRSLVTLAGRGAIATEAADAPDLLPVPTPAVISSSGPSAPQPSLAP